MRYVSNTVSVLVAAALVLPSCQGLGDITGGVNSKLRDFDFGYPGEQSLLQEIMGIDSKVFIPLSCQEEYDNMVRTGFIDPDELMRNTFEFTDGVTAFQLQTVPQDTRVKSVTVSSSDTEIVEYKGTLDGKYFLDVKKLGDVDLTVSVEGNGGTLTKVFPIRVIGTVEVRFRITPFWLRDASTRIRMNTRKLPKGTGDLVIWTKDSVTVVGYCEYYDLERFGRVPQYLRDTVTYATEEFMVHYNKLAYYLVRNVTGAVRDFEKRYKKGSKIRLVEEFNPVTLETRVVQDTVEYDYKWSTEQVILSWYPVCDNPYITFEPVVKNKRTFEHLGGGEDEGEDDEGDGTVMMSEEEYDGDAEETEADRETQKYFKVYYESFMKQSEKDSLMNVLDQFKKDAGYDASLSDEDKDAAIAKINEHLDDDDKVKSSVRRLFTRRR